MPFTRFITSSFLFAILLMAIVGPGNHPWFTDETLVLAVLFAICVWVMSLKRAFFLDVVAIFFSIFFLQRIVVIYFRPEEMSYQEGHLIYSSQIFNEAIIFCSAIAIAILLGYLLATFIKKGQKSKTINYDRVFGIRYNFELLFKVYALFFFVSVILESYLMVGLKVGITALDFDRQYAPLLRIVQIIQSLSILPILILASGKFGSNIRKIALVLLILILFKLFFMDTSKAALISLCIIYFVCLNYTGVKVPQKYVIIGAALFTFTIFILAPAVMMLRTGIAVSAVTSSDLQETVYMAKHLFTTPEQLFFGFMNRLGGFDWLTGFMTAGRDVFLPSASVSNNLIEIINSLVPGDLIELSPNYITISKLMPHILRGLDLGSYPGHAENMGGVGMAYLYFGKIGGVLFFFIWSFVSAKILNSNTSVVFKILFFTYFVFNFFLGGDLTTTVRLFYDGLLFLISNIFICEIISIKRYARP
jgi:hypothetical protein